jgi:hypothetical protein
MEQRGCAKVGGNLTFNSSWDHKQVVEWLDNLFPKLFTFARYMDSKKSHRSRTTPFWVLLSKEGRKLSIVPTLQPTGKDLLRYKGREKCSVSDSHIFVGKSYCFVIQYIAN